MGAETLQSAWIELLSQCVGHQGISPDDDTSTPPDLVGLGHWEAAEVLQQRYRPLLEPPRQRPLVVAQLGQSLDGRIATSTGHSHYVTGPADRTHLHRLRALVDVVVVGAGTVAKDDPRLTVRAVAGRNPARAVLLERDGLPADRSIFTDRAAPTWLVGAGHSQRLPADRQLVADPAKPATVLDALAATGAKRLLVEGGARTVSAWIAQHLVDVLYVTVAPVLIGSGPTGIHLPAINRMDEAWRPVAQQFDLGEDRLFRLDFSASPES